MENMKKKEEEEGIVKEKEVLIQVARSLHG